MKCKILAVAVRMKAEDERGIEREERRKIEREERWRRRENACVAARQFVCLHVVDVSA